MYRVRVELKSCMSLTFCRYLSPLQVVIVYPIPNDDDYVMGEYNGKMGRVLSTYIEKL